MVSVARWRWRWKNLDVYILDIGSMTSRTWDGALIILRFIGIVVIMVYERIRIRLFLLLSMNGV